jgi:hypothetical protein
MRHDPAATLSVVLIVKDEVADLADCLRSVGWADEVVVYDTGSTDGTQELARRLTPHVVDGYWDDDFAAARNRALAHATGTWVLSLDADEVFEGDPDRVRAAMARTDVDAWSLMVRSAQDDRGLPLGMGGAAHDTATTRMFRRSTHRWVGALHEQPVPVDSSAVDSVSILTGVTLLHSGYTTAAVVAKDKAARNVAIARRQLETALTSGADADTLESRRVHLARSLTMTLAFDEAVALAEEVLAQGPVRPRHALLLARGIAPALAAAGRHEDAARWCQVWEDYDDNPVFALAARVRSAVSQGDAQAALDAMGRIPTTTVNAYGERFDRVSLVKEEVWAHAAAGDVRRSLQVAVDAARRGVAPGAPAGLVAVLGDERAARVVAALPEALWREYVTGCVMDAGPQARRFLQLMAAHRPGDAAVLAGAAVLTPSMSLEEAAEWAVGLRRAGAAEACPLVAIAQDDRIDPRQRALAGALAHSAYGDERGLAGLAAALSRVDPADEAELAAELEILAPGLVSGAA